MDEIYWVAQCCALKKWILILLLGYDILYIVANMGISDTGNCTFRPSNDNTGLHPIYSARQAVSKQ